MELEFSKLCGKLSELQTWVAEEKRHATLKMMDEVKTSDRSTSWKFQKCCGFSFFTLSSAVCTPLVMLNIHKYLVETQVHKKGILLQMEFLPIVYRLQCSKSFLVRYSSHSSPTNSKRNNDSARCFQLIISTQFLKVLGHNPQKQLPTFFPFLNIFP